VIGSGAHLAAWLPLAPLDYEIFPHHFGLGSHPAEILGHEGQTITLFDPELAYLAKRGGARGSRRKNGQEWDLINQTWNLCRCDLGAAEPRWAHQQITDRLTESGGHVIDLDPDTHAAQNIEEAGAGGIYPDSGDSKLSSLRQHRGADQKGRRRHVAGNLDVERLDLAAGRKVDPAFLFDDPVSEGAQQPLGMVARASPRLVQCDLHLAGHTGQEDGALDLRAGDRHVVTDRVQAVPMDGKGQSIPVPFYETSPHRGERPGDAPHGAPAQRAIAGQCRREPMSREEAQQ
jgi:hypothetical protein